MSIKAAKKMRGFMCQSPGSISVVCMSNETCRSVIVPRRSELLLLDHSKLLRNAKYTRLTEPRGVSSAGRRSSIGPPSIRTCQERKPQAGVRSLASASADLLAFQVVVMKVSLHCQGCASKLKKHLAKMEGVTSFSIDLESKRVTVMGNISPIGVLESVSKVKRAEFWPC